MTIEEKQNYFLKSWNNNTLKDDIDSSFIPSNKKEAYEIQLGYETLSKYELFGWKVAATSKDGQKHIGVDGPLAGRLIKEKSFSNNSKISLKNNFMKLVEAEFAFKLSKNFPVRDKLYNFSEVLDGIDSCIPAIELPDSRFKNYKKLGSNVLISDNACAGEFVINVNSGKSPTNIDLSNFEVHCYKNNSLISVGIGKNVLENPLKALMWLINELNSLEINVLRKQIILTGTCIKPFSVERKDNILFDFNEFGKIACSFD